MFADADTEADWNGGVSLHFSTELLALYHTTNISGQGEVADEVRLLVRILRENRVAG